MISGLFWCVYFLLLSDCAYVVCVLIVYMFGCAVGFGCCSAFCGCCFAGVGCVGYFARLLWLVLACDCVSMMFVFGVFIWVL